MCICNSRRDDDEEGDVLAARWRSGSRMLLGTAASADVVRDAPRPKRPRDAFEDDLLQNYKLGNDSISCTVKYHGGSRRTIICKRCPSDASCNPRPENARSKTPRIAPGTALCPAAILDINSISRHAEYRRESDPSAAYRTPHNENPIIARSRHWHHIDAAAANHCATSIHATRHSTPIVLTNSVDQLIS